MKHLLFAAALLASFSLTASELDPTPAKAIVLQIDQETNAIKAFKVNESIVENGKLSEEKAQTIVNEKLDQLEEITELNAVDLKHATELDSERSVGNYYFYYYNYSYQYNYWGYRYSYFYYNTYRYNYYGYNYYRPWAYRYRYFYYY